MHFNELAVQSCFPVASVPSGGQRENEGVRKREGKRETASYGSGGNDGGRRRRRRGEPEPEMAARWLLLLLALLAAHAAALPDFIRIGEYLS